jgi:hypothetical protein
LRKFPEGKIDKAGFRKQYDNSMADLWFDVCDTNGDGTIDLKEFLCAQSILCKGSLKDKLKCESLKFEPNMSNGKTVRHRRRRTNNSGRNVRDDAGSFQAFQPTTRGIPCVRRSSLPSNGQGFNSCICRALTDIQDKDGRLTFEELYDGIKQEKSTVDFLDLPNKLL